MSRSLKDQYASTPLYGSNAAAVEALYEKYLEDPSQVPSRWRDYFETLGAPDTEIAHSAIRQELIDEARSGGRRKTRVRTKGRSAGARAPRGSIVRSGSPRRHTGSAPQGGYRAVKSRQPCRASFRSTACVATR